MIRRGLILSCGRWLVLLLLYFTAPAAFFAQPFAAAPQVLPSLDAAARIAALPAGAYALSLTGPLNTGMLRRVCAAIAANDSIRVSLDLSQVTGLSVITGDACGDCGNLVALTVPDGAASVHPRAFAGCAALAALEAGSDSERFSSRDGVLYSKDGAQLVLAAPALRGTLIVPAAVIEVSDDAFSLCDGLDAFSVEDGASFSAIDGCLYSGDGTLLVRCPPGRTQAVTVADGVTAVGDGAFADCARLSAVTLPRSVRVIGDHAFDGCSHLTAFSLPAHVAVIGKQAFAGCSRLESLLIPESVATVGSRAFYGCGLVSLEFALPDGWRCGRKLVVDLGDRVQNPPKFAFPGKYWPYDLYREDDDARVMRR